MKGTRIAVLSARDRRIIGVSFSILLANLAVAAGKLVYGVTLGSIAIEADGFHSLLDGVNNIVIIVAMSIAGKPADASHPYGHRKFELLASLFIGFLFVVLIARTAKDAFSALLGHPAQEISADAYVVVLLTIAINIVVTVVERAAGKRLESAVLLADARHTLSDVLVSITVLAGVYLSRRGVAGADALCALVVVGVIAWVGYGIVRNAIAGLADEMVLAPSAVQAEVLSVPGVEAVGLVRSRRYGREVKVDAVIKVDGRMSVAAAHAVADEVERAIARRWPEVSDVVVHLEPA